MTPRLKSYPTYKDSGVPWLGDVPAHWKVRKQRQVVKLLVSNVDKHSFENEKAVRLCNYVDVYKHDRITERLHFMKATATEDEINRFRLREGDVLVTKDSESWNDIGVPALVEYTADDLVCGYHLAILRPHTEQIIGVYLLRAIQSQGVASQYYISANGVTRYGLTHQGIKNVQIPIPPLPEQHAIARYLDHIDARIKRAIRAKRKLIALLNEQKQAIIHRAVTRGLDPDVPLRPSGVEWLGDIPAHWEVRRVKQVSQILRGKFTHRPRNDPSFYDGPYPFIQTGEVSRAEKSILGYRQTLNERGFAVSKLFPAGTLVMTIAANIGDVAVLDFDACFPDSIVGLVPLNIIERDYLYYVFLSMKLELLREAPVNTQGNLNIDRIGGQSLPLPPMLEQKLIMKKIEVDTTEVSAAMRRTKQQIDLIREYRTRLIADVVTGKLDVRAAAAGLPEELEEIEPDATEAEEIDLDAEPAEWEDESDAP
ncbi:Type I DNA specificity S subunit [Candidatus Promineifilum breve]|uniref:Type I DNA specificity S subunit n=1 Tax=Candidatus Promineifilum breve TaxID=1806508 RepID=A0A160T0F1_9CHLR|nr:restriction endonuclease subunit S [Candidatus Promineifilum breve]CUS01885.1 Type I DNA specificity S subunit [Candidatus Promineifilum breve]